MAKRNPRALLLVIVSTCAPGAWAWGPQGHRTIGAIADELISPATRTAVAQLLQGDRDRFGHLSGRATLEGVSDWADELNGTPAAEPRWHYDDAPICGRAPKSRYCPDRQCNSEQLQRLTAVLADRHAPERSRNEALKWVVHLVGDLHQPLHAADNADRGGNLVPVALAGVWTHGRENLHRVWDADLVTLALHTRDHQQPPGDITQLAHEAARLGRDAGQGSPDSWAVESNNLARNVVYNYAGFACTTVPRGIVILGAQYQEDAVPIVHERLLLAGARLAALLDQTLAPVAVPRGR